ncbi:sigma 54-interacting transcriptional regulator [Aneurinibacillus aneurinilyticus]|uniref:sigma 54-interacting transcriptional regulator n=1 Tax=Aneurinibacillus aneurinilyticus TaxID=1391 RepID=UPI0023F12391|nr:sigma 54-interacting transcriptional regulator [Aneurinibacillus aneurinilyticus]
MDVNIDTPERADIANGVLVESEKMKKIINVIHKIASVDSTVLLLGESGVGKTMLARLIHQASSRKDYPFVSINCSTLPDSLIESGLFGYESGTFTGGKTGGKQGLLEALQENAFRKIGSVDKQKANIRILSATNKNLKEMVNQKRFREDLYYRLHVVPLMIPPLRERREEILPLIEHFTRKFNQKYDRRFFLSPHLPVFSLPEGNIGIMITYDIEFPEAARILALKGVDILAVLAANMVPYQHYQDIYLHARALENHIYVAAANMVGLDNENIFFGESQIVHPDGRSIYKARNNEVVPVLTFDASKKVHNVVEKSTYPPKNKAIIFR